MAVVVPILTTYNGRGVKTAVTDLKSFKKAVAREGGGVAGGLAATGKLVQGVGKKVSATGMTMTRNLTLPIVGFGAAAGKSFMDFDSEMNKMKGLVGVGQKQLDQFSATILDKGADWGKSPQELAQALFFVTSAGQRGDTALNTLEASAKASAAGLGDTATIADAVTSAMNAYGAKNLSAAGATDILTNAVRLGKLEASDLAGVMGQVLPLSSQMGVSFDQVGGALAIMSKNGTDAAQGATQLKGIMSSFLKPSQGAVEQLKKYGLTAEDVRKSIKDKGLLKTLDMLKGKFHGNQEAMAKVFPNQRALLGFMSLTGKGAKANAKLMTDMAHSTGVADKAFEETTKTSKFQLGKALNEVKSTLITIGASVMPVVIDVLHQVTPIIKSLTDKWNNLTDGQKRMAVQVALVVAAAGPFLVVLGKALTVFGGVIRAVGMVVKVLGLAGKAIIWIGRLMLANPWLILVTLLVVAVVLIVKHWSLVKSFLRKTWEWIKHAAGATWDWIKNAISVAIRATWNVIKKVWHFVTKIFLNWTGPGILINHWRDIKNAISDALGKVKQWISDAWDFLKRITGKAWQAITDTISGVWDTMTSLGSDVVHGLWQGLQNSASWIKDKVVAWVKQILPGPIAKVLGIASPSKLFIHYGKMVGQGLANGVLSMTGTVEKAATRLAHAAASGATTALKQAKSAAAKVLSYARSTSSTFRQSAGLGDLAGNGPVGSEQIQSFLTARLDQFRSLAGKLRRLRKAGVPSSFIRDVIAAGPQGGNQLADAILSGGSGFAAELQSLDKQLNAAARRVGSAGAYGVYGQSVQSARGVKHTTVEVKAGAVVLHFGDGISAHDRHAIKQMVNDGIEAAFDELARKVNQ